MNQLHFLENKVLLAQKFKLLNEIIALQYLGLQKDTNC